MSARGRAAVPGPACPADRHALVLGCRRWLGAAVAKAVPPALYVRLGKDHWEQEAWRAVVVAAARWDPTRGAPFGAFAWLGVAQFLRGRVMREAARYGVWRELPAGADILVGSDEGGVPLEPADHRAASAVHPTLAAWCDEDAARQRRRLDPRSRLVLYLRLVEGWSNPEIGSYFGISRERVRQVIGKAVFRLARARAGGVGDAWLTT